MVQRILCAVETGPEVFPSSTRASAVESASNAPAPTNLFSPSESNRTQPPRAYTHSSSPGVWSLSAYPATEARSSRAYLTRHLPASGFHTLLPACVFRSLPTLFHAGNARRVFLQGFFPPQSLRPLSEPVTFLVLAVRPSRPSGCPENRRLELASPSRVYSLRGFATAGRGVNHEPTTAALLVFGPLGISPLRRPDRLRKPFPSGASQRSQRRACARPRLAAALQGIDHRKVSSSLARLLPLLAFSHLIPKAQDLELVRS